MHVQDIQEGQDCSKRRYSRMLDILINVLTRSLSYKEAILNFFSDPNKQKLTKCVVLGGLVWGDFSQGKELAEANQFNFNFSLLSLLILNWRSLYSFSCLSKADSKE